MTIRICSRFFVSVLLGFLFAFESHAIQVELKAYNFYGEKPYTECHIRVNHTSLSQVDSLSASHGSVNLLIMVLDSANQVIAFDKLILTSPAGLPSRDMLTVKRFALSPGNYTIRLEADETLFPENKVQMERSWVVKNQAESCEVSDLLLLGAFEKTMIEGPMVKNGFYMEPLPYNYTIKDKETIDFYVELYTLDSRFKDSFFLQMSIREWADKGLQPSPKISKYRKIAGSVYEPLLLSLPVKELRSGNYQLSVSMVDKNKRILSTSETSFIHRNPAVDIAWLETSSQDIERSFVSDLKEEDMDYILKAHVPLTSQEQLLTLRELIQSNRLKSKRHFIWTFWNEKYPSNPAVAYQKYMEVANAVNKQFHTNSGLGVQSDRGYIFLKYGKPTNVITIDTEVDAPPYEIWYYSNLALTRQTNVRFLFYNPSLVHNDFRLLHSTCLGERMNPAWETELYKSVPLERLGNTVDATQVKENFNRNARRYFNEY